MAVGLLEVYERFEMLEFDLRQVDWRARLAQLGVGPIQCLRPIRAARCTPARNSRGQYLHVEPPGSLSSRNSVFTRRRAYKLLSSPGASGRHDNDVPMVKAPPGALG
ncbi:hypothetical protein HNP84_007083 [Thermocatellispora tengchongensis]|uniref:Uncharacterized protein n=1 Tax=Thermocatellispora tengchongensis TaxID=1073253 RepID=A0A840PHP2_9ACTN|nr:hypothetical protein [Thermocatellispora tengchongensis]MBB5137331.1 hypothetical protein [Thermocatellispora tengchongensis]